MQKIKFKNIAKSTQNKLVITYSIIIFTVIGLIVTIFFIQSNKLKRLILEKVEIAATSIDTEDLYSLSSKVKPVQDPTYNRLKKQLIKLEAEIPNCQYMYILHKIDDKFYFLINAVPLSVE